MAKIKHVSFDCDGTLYIQPPELEEKIDNAIYAELAKVTGKPVSVIRDEYKKKLKTRGTNTKVMTDYGLTPDRAREIYNSPNIAQYVKPDPLLGEALVYLKNRDISLSVFTNNKPETLNAILERLQVDKNWFTFVLTGEDISKPKPSFEGYAELIQRTGYAPNEIMFVGDRVLADIVPSEQSGMHTLLVRAKESNVHYNKERGTYHFTRPSIYQLPEVIAELNGLLESQDKGQ